MSVFKKYFRTLILLCLFLSSYLVYLYYTWDNRRNISVPHFNSALGTVPAKIGVIKGHRGYIYFKASFLVLGVDGYPNLFQTSSLNKGLRIEISGTDMNLVINVMNNPVSPATDSSFHVLNLTSNLKVNEWYDFTLEALDGVYVSATLNGIVVNFTDARIKIGGSDIIVGSGFDESRKFIGQIKKSYIIKGNFPRKII
jgi:hypothetical protein